MDKAAEAATLAGIASNIGFPIQDRLTAANQSLDFYVPQADRARKLLEYLESRDPRDEDGDSELGYYESMYQAPAYRDAARRLRRILDGEDDD